MSSTVSNIITITESGEASPLTVSFSYSPGQTVLVGQSYTVTANPSGGCGGYTYLWGDGATAQSQTFVANTAGTYTGSVTVTDSCGNSASASWSVTVTEGAYEFTATYGCYKTASGYTDVELSATFTGGTGPFTWEYVWPDGTVQTGSISSSSGGTASTSRAFPEADAEFQATVIVTDSTGSRISTTVSTTTLCS